MTRAEARRRAVEAAGEASHNSVCSDWDEVLWNAKDGLPYAQQYVASHIAAMEAAVAAYERAMSDAGWRMVRVVEPEIEKDLPGPLSARDVLALQVGRQIGHNACRAAMLEDGE